jgi:hypothetical protein
MDTNDAVGITFALAAAFVVASAASAGENKTLKVTNGTHKPIVGVYLTPLACDDDHDDALGDRVIRPGRSQTVDVPSSCGCRYNLRFVFRDKGQIDRFDVDICKKRSYRIRDH